MARTLLDDHPAAERARQRVSIALAPPRLDATLDARHRRGASSQPDPRPFTGRPRRSIGRCVQRRLAGADQPSACFAFVAPPLVAAARFMRHILFAKSPPSAGRGPAHSEGATGAATPVSTLALVSSSWIASLRRARLA